MFYEKNDAIYNKNFMEMYFPKNYFEDDRYAKNHGNKVLIFGLFPIREIIDGKPQKIKMFNIPMFIDIRKYHTKVDSLTINNNTMEVITSEYPKDSYLFSKSIPQSVEIAEKFIQLIMDGKVPPIIEYKDIIDILWKCLEIAGVNLKVPSALYETLIMTMCRNKDNPKERFGIKYGKDLSISDNDYIQMNTRSVVSNLSTFSGIVFEDINKMISNGVANTINELEEPVSPLEKIIHY